VANSKTHNVVLDEVMAWLARQIAAGDFQDVSVTLSIHAGRIAKIQKSVTEKIAEKMKNPGSEPGRESNKTSVNNEYKKLS